ncbi:UPF0104 family protein [Microbispora sp. RL4-1S]|uniref:UPF0104 family protein n=1 Tax=Microbispora oryzae TaxID=2806554 RepID=A0A940WK78_9ACTN|nr:YbhN family protein [Microbispora oryzae]MBP2706493.1 UPF0104 family protein [Microbispora oryzae]
MSSRLRWVPVAGAAGLAVFVLRDRLPDGSAVAQALTGLDLGWLGVAALAQWISMAMFARLVRRVLVVGGTRLPLPRAVALTYARTALSNSLPAGSVLSLAYVTRQLSRAGAAKPLIAATLVLSGVYSSATFVLLGLVALLAEPAARPFTAAVLALLVALPLIVWAVARPRFRSVRAWLTARVPAVMTQLEAAFAAVRPGGRDRLALVTLALGNWVLDMACLAAVCAASGVEVGAPTVLLGYVAAKGAGMLALIPGGLGAAELGLGATLVAAGVAGGAATAVVLLYRLISFWAVLLVGWICWVLLLDSVRARLAGGGRVLLSVLLRLAAAMEPAAGLYGFRLNTFRRP